MKSFSNLSIKVDIKRYIREAIGKIRLHTIDNVLKNWTDPIGYCMASRGSHIVFF